MSNGMQWPKPWLDDSLQQGLIIIELSIISILLNPKLRFVSQGFSTSPNNISISILSASNYPSMILYIYMDIF